ncbi:pyridine nucleotide-disulfide oxidoreductase-domain-containing protein [Alternaria rosae]|uniref:pyridine nucleotide-disulfide oxidoreductase-domain-containing protein n=1 Tax=Alternaria rosae TaxID=1187941 RepID=UPI001E8E103E|nr:pyridine nucleotide-disulfide oxidoreductase-domain-containing protein [Alternaria rosae]KAH6865263.1 pyridine nucleotide-disulfide oxidoreductase-domain-containing protein [Alternaria rosae]
MTETISADYLVIGAGAAGMAFVDTLISDKKETTVAIVDRYSRPGGHWTVAYPFVTLHQPSFVYGVNSRPLGDGKIDQVGFNKGLTEVATGDEIVAYYTKVLNNTLLPSGRVTYYPLHNYTGDGEFQSIVTGKAIRVGPNTRIVDSTYVKITVPSMGPPSYEVADKTNLVTPNALATLKRPYGAYTIVGAGKTATTPNPEKLLQEKSDAIMGSKTSQEMFHRMEELGHAHRLDKSIEPTMFRHAIVTKAEFDEVKRVKNIIRQGRVKRIDPDKVTLEKGTYTPMPDTLFIDCAAAALGNVPPVPVFNGRNITIQNIKFFQPTFSAALIGHVEGSYDDENLKNYLCDPFPYTRIPAEYPTTLLASMKNRLKWMAEPKVSEWCAKSRLDFPIMGLPPRDPEKAAAFNASIEQRVRGLCDHLEQMAKNDAAGVA